MFQYYQSFQQNGVRFEAEADLPDGDWTIYLQTRAGGISGRVYYYDGQNGETNLVTFEKCKSYDPWYDDPFYPGMNDTCWNSNSCQGYPTLWWQKRSPQNLTCDIIGCSECPEGHKPDWMNNNGDGDGDGMYGDGMYGDGMGDGGGYGSGYGSAGGGCNDNGMEDNGEMGIDCGGGGCPACSGGGGCNDNGMEDNGEMGIDCGGGGCPACGGGGCNDNGVQDNGEMGIDCGGGGCMACRRRELGQQKDADAVPRFIPPDKVRTERTAYPYMKQPQSPLSPWKAKPGRGMSSAAPGKGGKGKEARRAAAARRLSEDSCTSPAVIGSLSDKGLGGVDMCMPVVILQRTFLD